MRSKISFLWIIFSLGAFFEFRTTSHNVGTYGTVYRKLKSNSTTFKASENDTVTLPCYNNASASYVSWFRDNLLLRDTRQEPGPADPFDRVFLYSNGSLQVSNIKIEDNAEYVCEITSATGSLRQFYDIEIQYPPVIILSPTGVIELPVGSMLEIICDAKGVPYPSISLTFNSTVRTENFGNETRTILEISSREMSGVIECKAENGVGDTAIAIARLNVLFTPEITVRFQIVHTKIGMQASLECVVVSAPASTVHWFLNGNSVELDLKLVRRDQELRSNKSVEDYITESKHVLLFKRVRDNDFGVYECRAENRIGFKGVFLELTGKPKLSTFKMSVNVPSSVGYHLMWLTESLSPIIEYKLKFRKILSGDITPGSKKTDAMWNELTIPAEYSEGSMHSMTYNIRGLEPGSIYEANVASRNRYGWSDVSRTMRFASRGEVSHPLPSFSTERRLQSDSSTDASFTDVNLTDAVENFEYKRTDYSGTSKSLFFASFCCTLSFNLISTLI